MWIGSRVCVIHPQNVTHHWNKFILIYYRSTCLCTLGRALLSQCSLLVFVSIRHNNTTFKMSPILFCYGFFITISPSYCFFFFLSLLVLWITGFVRHVSGYVFTISPLIRRNCQTGSEQKIRAVVQSDCHQHINSLIRSMRCLNGRLLWGSVACLPPTSCGWRLWDTCCFCSLVEFKIPISSVFGCWFPTQPSAFFLFHVFNLHSCTLSWL